MAIDFISARPGKMNCRLHYGSKVVCFAFQSWFACEIHQTLHRSFDACYFLKKKLHPIYRQRNRIVLSHRALQQQFYAG